MHAWMEVRGGDDAPSTASFSDTTKGNTLSDGLDNHSQPSPPVPYASGIDCTPDHLANDASGCSIICHTALSSDRVDAHQRLTEPEEDILQGSSASSLAQSGDASKGFVVRDLVSSLFVPSSAQHTTAASSPSFNSHLRQRVSVKATPETDISEDRRSDEIIPRIQGQSDKLSDCGEATCQYSESLPSSSFSAESSIPSAPSTLLAPFFMIFSSSRRSPYLPVLASGPPSSRAVKSTFPRLKKILLTTLLLFLLLQGLLFFPYLIGEDRANQWGWQHPSDWLGFKNSLWRFMPPPVSHLPLHVQHPPDSSSLPLHHLSLDLLNSLSTEAPYMLASDPRRVTAEAFPPPWGAFVQYDAAKSYPQGNPHAGVIPPLQLHLLNSVPTSQRPRKPLRAPEVNSTMFTSPQWTRALNGSRTTFADTFRAHLQQTEIDQRLSPWNTWKPPLESLDPAKAPAGGLSKVQYAFENPSQRSGKANDSQREQVLEERQRLVKAAFLHSWEGYKRIAWGHDELKPISQKAQDPFNGWGATIVDALDTLLVMDLPDEYNYAREHVRDINFWLLGGERSAYGRSDGRIPVFETAIRYLGGFLSAYDLSGDEMMRDRAEELAQLILPAFFTRSGVPLGRLRFGQTPLPSAAGGVLLAEAGSLLLEFTRLWQVTGNRTYFDRVQRTTDWFDRNMTKSARLGALFPTTIMPESGTGWGWYSFGGMADSFYEYLIKEHQLLGGRLSQYGRMYSDSVDSARKYLIKEIKTVPNLPLVTFGAATTNRWEPKMEHLACFTGGMLGLGSKLMPAKRGQDFDLAQRMTETCWWTYNSSATGIGPEETYFYRAGDPGRFEIYLDPDGTQRRGKGRGSPIVGVSRQVQDYRGRPETIESVFYMWRITGDPIWQDRGWQMFASWVTHAITKVGFANVQDVQSLPAMLSDNMESFVFAETFKYYYLLFSPPDLISLDDYVLSTEAHPLLVPKDGRWVGAGNGPRSFWRGPFQTPKGSEYSGGEDADMVGGLTNVQKHFVYRSWVERKEQERLAFEKAEAEAKLAEVVKRAKLAGSEAVEILVSHMKEWLGKSPDTADPSAEPTQTDDSSGGDVATEGGRILDVKLTDEIATALRNLQDSGVVKMPEEGELDALPRSAIIQTNEGLIKVRFQVLADEEDAYNDVEGDDDEPKEGFRAIADAAVSELTDIADQDKEEPHAPSTVLRDLPREVADEEDLTQLKRASISALRYAAQQLMNHETREPAPSSAELESNEREEDAAHTLPSATEATPLGMGFGARLQQRFV